MGKETAYITQFHFEVTAQTNETHCAAGKVVVSEWLLACGQRLRRLSQSLRKLATNRRHCMLKAAELRRSCYRIDMLLIVQATGSFLALDVNLSDCLTCSLMITKIGPVIGLEDNIAFSRWMWLRHSHAHVGDVRQRRV